MAQAVAIDAAMRGFVDHLRLNGYKLGVADAMASLRAMEMFPPLRAEQAKGVLCPLLTSERSEWLRFGEMFDAYWLGKGVRQAQAVSYSQATRNVWSSRLPALSDTDGDLSAAGTAREIGEDESDDDSAHSTTIPKHASKSSRGSEMTAETAEDKERLVACGARLANFLCRRKSRRRVPARRGRGVDLRRSMRRNLSVGGEPFFLIRQRRKVVFAQLSVLLDVSASMKEHFGFFLFLLKGMLSATASVEAFIFHTRLVRMSSSLRAAHGGKGALERFTLQTQGAGGGTRIAGCLDDFMCAYGGRWLGGRHVVLVISDGYDSEHGEKLAGTLAALRRRVSRIYWLSPAAGAVGEAHLSRALYAARPQITALAPARSVEDIQRLPMLWREFA